MLRGSVPSVVSSANAQPAASRNAATSARIKALCLDTIHPSRALDSYEAQFITDLRKNTTNNNKNAPINLIFISIIKLLQTKKIPGGPSRLRPGSSLILPLSGLRQRYLFDILGSVQSLSLKAIRFMREDKFHSPGKPPRKPDWR